ncbi:hypothetical protein NIA69_21160 [Gemmiger formicilis]|nr:hypothetical protein [Gemmiger formicilis]
MGGLPCGAGGICCGHGLAALPAALLPGGGSDPYTSDLGMHLAFAQRGMVYSTVSLLIGPAYALAGRIGIAVLLAAFHLAAVAVFAYGLRTALPDARARRGCWSVWWSTLPRRSGCPAAATGTRALSAARFITTQRILCSRPLHCWRCWPLPCLADDAR